MAEFDTNRHPIKMHCKQLPAIRLNYWNSEARLNIAYPHPTSRSQCYRCNKRLAWDWINMRIQFKQQHIVSHLFRSSELQWPDWENRLWFPIVWLSVQQPRWRRCKMNIISIANLVICRRHTWAQYNVVCVKWVCKTRLKWIFYGICCWCQLFISSHCKCTY